MEGAFEVASNAIIHEILGDEVIIANLDLGTYYSLRGSGVLVWQLILSGHSLSSITSLFGDQFSFDTSEMLKSFIDQIIAEGLIKQVLNKPASQAEPSFTWPSVFNPPTFEKYEEMKNLLMLDPIHEVDEQGWPSRS